MPWHYMEDDQQMGPISEDELQQRIESGEITAATLIKNETMEDWIPAEQLKNSAPAPLFPCSMCNKKFPEEDLIQFEGSAVCAGCKPVFLQQMRENAEISGDQIMRYVGFWRRGGALMIDGVIMYLLQLPIGILFGIGSAFTSSEGDGSPGVMLALIIPMYILQFLLPALYYILMNGKYGATLGKKAVGIKIVMSDGEPITYGRAIGRYFAYILSGIILYIGYIMAAFDEEKRALHDHICDTRVIYKS